MSHYLRSREELLSRASDLFDWVAAGELDVRIGAEFALADAADAHRALEGRETSRKSADQALEKSLACGSQCIGQTP